MLFQKLGYTDVKTQIMFIENKIAFYQIIKRNIDMYKIKFDFDVMFNCVVY